ncbi:MAG: hypothetical protein R2713_22210 [Ilumatobacteraceae bacterium]
MHRAIPPASLLGGTADQALIDATTAKYRLDSNYYPVPLLPEGMVTGDMGFSVPNSLPVSSLVKTCVMTTSASTPSSGVRARRAAGGAPGIQARRLRVDKIAAACRSPSAGPGDRARPAADTVAHQGEHGLTVFGPLSDYQISIAVGLAS